MIEGPVFAIGSNLVGGAFRQVNGDVSCSNAVRVTSSNLTCASEALNDTGHIRAVRAISTDGRTAIFETTGREDRMGYLLEGWLGWKNAYLNPMGLGTVTAIGQYGGTNVYLGASGKVVRYSTRITYADNQLLGVDLHEDFLLLRPRRAWKEEFEYSEDLQTWHLIPDYIRDTNVTKRARFYRIKPR
jgi:hypothetical protein